LRNVVQPDVEKLFDAGPLQKTEELFCRLLSETDGIDFHSPASLSSKRMSCGFTSTSRSSSL
jgi:hypothetical protein